MSLQRRYLLTSSPNSEPATELTKKMKLLEGAKGDYVDKTAHLTHLPVESHPNLDTFHSTHHHLHHPPIPIYIDHERRRDQQQFGPRDGGTVAQNRDNLVDSLQSGLPAAPPPEAQPHQAHDFSYRDGYGHAHAVSNAQAQAAPPAYWSYYQQWYAVQHQNAVPQLNASWPTQYQYPLTQPYFAGGQVQQEVQPQVTFMQTRYPLRHLNATVPAFTPLHQPQPQQLNVSLSPEFRQRLQQSNRTDDVSQPVQAKTGQQKAKKQARKLQQTLLQAGPDKSGSNTGSLQPPLSSANSKMTREPADDNGYRGTKQTQRIHVLARPVPSASYLQRSLEVPQVTSISRPLLVILDLNGTLLFRKKHGGSNKFVARPQVHEFLDYLFSNHSVMVWSSARPENVNKMCSDLFTPKQSYGLVAMWARDKLQLPSDAYWQKVQVYKQLSWVWNDNSIQVMNPRIGIESWDQTNTVLIDDSFEKGASEPHNLIQIDEFEGREDQMQDDVLSQVERYLETLRSQANVSAYMRANPFKNLPGNGAAFGSSASIQDQSDLDTKHSALGGVLLDGAGTSLQRP